MTCFFRYFAILNLFVLLSGCATFRGLSDRELVQAEPLFGAAQDKCMDDPMFVFHITAPVDEDEKDFSHLTSVECQKLAKQLAQYDPGGDEFSTKRRNEVIDGLVAVSNRKCGRYSAYLKTFDGATNSGLSIASILTGGVGSILQSADAARALSGSSAIFSGTRTALNQTWFSNQTIQVLVAAYENRRHKQSQRMTNLQQCTVQQYSVMDGFADAFEYHNSCSLIAGLSEAAIAVERVEQPGIATLRRQLADLTNLNADVNGLINADFPEDPVKGSVLIEQMGRARADVEFLQDNLASDKALLTNARISAPARIREELGLAADQVVTAAQIAQDLEVKAITDRIAEFNALYSSAVTARDAAEQKVKDFSASQTDARRTKAAARRTASPQSPTILQCPFEIRVKQPS